MNYNLSKNLLEELASWLFLLNSQAQDSFQLYAGVEFEELPDTLKTRLLEELKADKEDFEDIIFHDAVGNIPIHDDKNFELTSKTKHTILIPLKIINQHVYTGEDSIARSTFIHYIDNQINFSELKVSKYYKFSPEREHGIMTNCRIMMLVLWIK